MELLEIPVEKLAFGMFVSKLDRPWTETPFAFQGFVLQKDKQLEVLKKYCKHVYVDPEKAVVQDVAKVTAEDIAKVRGTTVYRDAASVEHELPVAQKAFSNTSAVLGEISRVVQTGNTIDSSRSHEAVAQITASVVRNPDAMALLIKLQEKSGTTLSRAAEVSVMMTIFGRFLQLPPDRLEILGMLGLLQDVGKLKLPPELAARGPSDDAEMEIYKTHVINSVRILSDTPGLPPELPGLASLHHERFDGAGYPRGLKGDAIAFPGLIAAIVDTFDTLTAPKPLGQGLSPANALSAIYKERGRQFHPALVEQFIQCVGVFPVGCLVEMNSGEVAVVIAQNMVRRMQPRIMIVRDMNGNPLRPYKMLDLMKEPQGQARRTLPYPALPGIRFRRNRPQRAVSVSEAEPVSAAAPGGEAAAAAPFIDALRAQVAERQADGGHLAVLLIECGVVGRIDAVWGYQVGDSVRARVAGLLRADVLRPDDLLGELGRDDFACVLSIVDSPAVAMLAATKSLRALGAPFWIGEDEIYASPAIGIAMFPEHGEEAETLLQRAKSACALARDLDGSIADYGEDRDHLAASRLLYENRLRSAVTEDAINLIFQPQYDLRLGQVMGAEGLLRWRDPTLGMIPALDAFVAAESADVVIQLVSSILNRALRNISEFRYSAGLDLRVGVKLPARVLRHPELIEVVERALGTWSRRPGTLILEIGETAVLGAEPATRTTLGRLKELGVKLSIDDPGMAFSSLFWLATLPFQEIQDRC
jgi:diguanylate cyclase (GGDEF)-like protein